MPEISYVCFWMNAVTEKEFIVEHNRKICDFRYSLVKSVVGIQVADTDFFFATGRDVYLADAFFLSVDGQSNGKVMKFPVGGVYH